MHLKCLELILLYLLLSCPLAQAISFGPPPSGGGGAATSSVITTRFTLARSLRTQYAILCCLITWQVLYNKRVNCRILICMRIIWMPSRKLDIEVPPSYYQYETVESYKEAKPRPRL
jgi:hypothetical protein